MAVSLRIEWRQVVACFVLLAASAAIAATYSLVAVPLAREFAVNRLTLMLPITICSGVSALLSPVLGRRMDRGALRGMMLAGAVLLPLGYLALSFVTAFPLVLLVFGLLMAPATVLIGPVAVAVLLSRWFVEGRGRALGIAMAGVSMGGFAFAPILQALLDGNGWRMAFRLLAAIMAVCAVPAALLVRDRGVAASAATPVAAKATGRSTAGTILAQPAFWLLGLILAVTMAGLTGVITNLAPLALDVGLTPAAAAAMISIFTGCSFLAKLLFAGLADRLGPRRMIYGVLLGFAAGMGCLVAADAGIVAIAAGVALVGLFGGLMVPLQSLLAPRIFGADVVGQVMGMLSVVILVALLATPPLFGFVFDRTGSYDAVFIAFIVLAGVMLLAARQLARRLGDDTPAVARAGAA